MKPAQSEASNIALYIIPLFEKLGYPGAGDPERVKINDVPVFSASGGKRGSMDIVYYQDGVPLLLVEAKRANKSHASALKQAEDYLRNFPSDKKEYAKTGIPPRYIATTVGKEIRFYSHRFELTKDGASIRHISEEIEEPITFNELLEQYGIVEKYRPKTLTAEAFRNDFLLYLIESYCDKNRLVTPDVIENISLHMLNYLRDQKSYTLHPPYTEITGKWFKQEMILDLHKRFDLISSLGPEIAKSYRNVILRAFQGTKLNQYLTEQCVISFMFDLMGDIDKNWKVLDFECGSGGFLAEAAKRDAPMKNMLGIDIDNLPCIIARTYLALYFGKTGREIGRIPIETDNGLFKHGNDWDLVVGNPAGSSRYEKDDIDDVLRNLEKDLDQNGRDDTFSEYNFSIQQAIRSCKVGGKICLVLPEGFFSNSQDEFLRRYVAKYCRALAIVSLPRGVFKKGKTSKSEESKGQTATMKMSILYAEKARLVIDGSGIAVDDKSLDYPVFMANVSKPESASGEICDWLGPELDKVLKEWKSWKGRKGLTEL